jgi:hypothetical protein
LKSEERRKAEHVCNPDNIATAKLIKSDTRSCPNCNEGYTKLGLRPDVVHLCKTPFDWNTGKIIAEIYTFFEWRRDNQLRERPHDVICGRTHHQIPKQILSV